MNERLLREIVTGLAQTGYGDALLCERYRFKDWFDAKDSEVEVDAAAFGMTPVSYDTACIGVVSANGLRGQSLVNKCRSLCAPFVLEVDRDSVREWAVSRLADHHALLGEYGPAQIRQLFAERANDWKPESLLRAKNIGSFRWVQQLGLFAGLLPELEENIQSSLEPLIRSALSETKRSYGLTCSVPESSQLFRLIFSLLTAKVFCDRGIPGFTQLDESRPDDILAAVWHHYRSTPMRLLSKEARGVAAERIWRSMDFRNLSVEVLSQIWSTSLLDDDTKDRLGIHRTSRTIVRYIVERIPFTDTGDDTKLIVEPCAGSAVFLVGAMNQLRKNLFATTPKDRHNYFVRHLVGIEKDPFGIEISRLALTLADFPNPDGWELEHDDVFTPNSVLPQYMRRAGIVLCNPPFGDFDKNERRAYRPTSPKKPAELLSRILDYLHPRGVLGFVLPRAFVDGASYKNVRRRIAERFSNIELTVLPDRAFEGADPEVCLLVATDPIPHILSRVIGRKVSDSADAWSRFENFHETSSEHGGDFTPEEAASSFGLPALPAIWDYLVNFPTLGDIAELHRGLEWNRPLKKQGAETGNRSRFVRPTEADGFAKGVPPQSQFNVFETPALQYLSIRPEDQRKGSNAYKLPWTKAKAIVNKAARSRGYWRLSAFPDADGLVCYQTLIGVWPTAQYDEVVLAAILNSPVANAFVSTREGKTDITIEVMKRMPVPHLTEAQQGAIRNLVDEYRRVSDNFMIGADASRLLMEIDATVLDGFRMPPRLEQELLEFFIGMERSTPHSFRYPKRDDVFFSLSDRISPQFSRSTVGALRDRMSRRKHRK